MCLLLCRSIIISCNLIFQLLGFFPILLKSLPIPDFFNVDFVVVVWLLLCGCILEMECALKASMLPQNYTPSPLKCFSYSSFKHSCLTIRSLIDFDFSLCTVSVVFSCYEFCYCSIS